MRKLERKDYYIILVIILFIFLIIPITVFKEIFGDYFKFLDRWTNSPMKFVKRQIVSKISNDAKPYRGYLKLPEIKFIKFKVEVSNANTVYVIGDFNKWTNSNVLIKKNLNIWETEIPLVKGRYRYLFVVDGKRILDPLNPEVDYYNNEKVSIIEVK